VPSRKEGFMSMKSVRVETRHGPIAGHETPFGIIVMIDPKWLDVDNGPSGYQRAYDEKWAQRIADNWDDSKARPVNVRLRDGYLYVTNGQHTANAAVKAGRNQILAIINNGRPSREREAREFRTFQTAVKRMTAYDNYRAALVAQEPDALILRKVTAELGITVGPKKDKGRPGLVLTSLTAARRIAAEGEASIRNVLGVCLVWDETDGARFRYEVLEAVQTAIEGNGTAVVLANARRNSARDLWANALAKSGGKGGYVAIAMLASLLGKKARGKTPNVLRET
jgi:hypothetical protein